MHYKSSIPRKIFVVFNTCFIAFACVICLYPLINTLAVSLSSKAASESGVVTIFPVDFQLDVYSFLVEKPEFLRAFWVSVKRVVLAVAIQLTTTILTAYPMSKSVDRFPHKNKFMWMYVVTMLFGGGLIPTYLVVNATGIMNTMLAFILPGALPVYNMILLQNYFKSLPEELYDSARIDGAGEWLTLFRIFLPLSKPMLATITLYIMVGHWNSWFDGMLYMNRAEKYPLQTYLRSIVINLDSAQITDLNQVMSISAQNNKSAQIIAAMIPILCVYPFIQKYFVKGTILGAVKG